MPPQYTISDCRQINMMMGMRGLLLLNDASCPSLKLCTRPALASSRLPLSRRWWRVYRWPAPVLSYAAAAVDLPYLLPLLGWVLLNTDIQLSGTSAILGNWPASMGLYMCLLIGRCCSAAAFQQRPEAQQLQWPQRTAIGQAQALQLR